MPIPPAFVPSASRAAAADRWIYPTPAGLFVAPGGFFIDPVRAVERAVITHGHSDHARGGHAHVLATPATLAVMEQRLGRAAGVVRQPLDYGTPLTIGDARVTLVPAGHVLGSAQVVVEHARARVVASGDYKRRPDPTCAPFVPVPCDVFVTEATFALPIFRHPPAEGEIARLLHSLALFPERSHLVSVYALGKCQRVIALLRAAGYDHPIYLHSALEPLCALYARFGVALGDLRPAAEADSVALRGAVVLTSGGGGAWMERLTDPVTAVASGWVRVRQWARQRGAELPLVISDHADWDELTATLAELSPAHVWITHGRDDALSHYAARLGIRARALALVGRGGEGDGGEGG